MRLYRETLTSTHATPNVVTWDHPEIKITQELEVVHALLHLDAALDLLFFETPYFCKQMAFFSRVIRRFALMQPNRMPDTLSRNQ